jgi:hypothetical protein
MYDDKSLSRSENYFLILQLLRMFRVRVKETIKDCEILQGTSIHGLAWSIALKYAGPEGPQEREEEEEKQAALVIVKANWKVVGALQAAAGDRLLSFIDSKTEEVKSLRDGVSGTPIPQPVKSC